MASKITNFEEKRAFTKVTTSSGVVGIVASEVPMAALAGLYEKLLASQSKLMASNSTANSDVPETTEEFFSKESPSR
ncbi:hypothetical protein RAE19_18385 [Rhodoferax sp. TBRC 17660]|uniref:Uncharacterized protein n=1 Tax=Rhodoferax potami TaxID=3068338 RepID=A0ABU3KTR1_9BURK|nr:hypothetical protein [Rhodoferax sp. TBRC 17660]MDT7520634.1 hypothetical protein [Rhodoferax sp. TBRC 17660]